jgi:hypothetical protein
LPEAAAVKVALAPAETVSLAGWVVMLGDVVAGGGGGGGGLAL